VVLDGGTIVNMLAASRPRPADLPRAISELAGGNAQLFLKDRAAATHVADVPEQALGMTESFVCREWAPYGASGAILHAGRRVFPMLPSSVLINAVQLPFQHQLCGVWNVPAGPSSQRVRVHSAIPTLVVSGEIDAKTGADWGRYAARTLPNSTYVRIRAIGHWVIARSPCAQKIFQSFLRTPLSPTTSCAKTAPEIDFK
jgi:pimeloyl-ACP methyl ester carboxylesterase